MGRCAGVFDEGVFSGIDYVLAQAARFGIKVIIALNNCWEDHDGVGNVRVPVSSLSAFGLFSHPLYSHHALSRSLEEDHVGVGNVCILAVAP